MQGAFGELEPQVELVCPDAPSLADGRSGWWNAVAIDGQAPPIKHYEGWQRTRDATAALARIVIERLERSGLS